MDITKRELKVIALSDENCPFEQWYKGVRDVIARAQIRIRLTRVEGGNFGDHKIFSGGIGELRVDVGPGYRVYFVQDGATIVVLLAGGDKSSQSKDIERARKLWSDHQNDTQRFQRDFRG